MGPVTGEPVTAALTGHGGFVTGLAFHPHGHLLASADGWTIRLWNPVTGDPAGAVPVLYEGGVRRIAFDHEGHLLAAACSDGTVRVWDPATGALAADPFACPRKEVWALAFRPGGRVLVTAGVDGTDGTATDGIEGDGEDGAGEDGDGTGSAGAVVRLHDLDTGESVTRPLTGQAGEIVLATLNPDATWLAAAVNDPLRPHQVRTVRLWDVGSGEPVADPFESPCEEIWAMAFHPDGRLLAVGGKHWRYLNYRLQLWDPVTGSHQALYSGLYDQPDHVRTVAFHPGGHVLATGSHFDTDVQQWTLVAAPVGAPLVHHGESVRGLAFHPDGHLLAAVIDSRTVWLWDPATGAPVTVPPVGRAEAVAFHPGGRVLATAYSDETGGTVRLSDLVTGEPIGAPLAGHVPHVSVRIAFQPGGRLLATTDLIWADHIDIVWLWDVDTGELVDGLPMSRGIRKITFHPGGRWLAVTEDDGTVRLWDPFTGEPACVPIRTGYEPGSRPGTVVFHPDGHLLATATATVTGDADEVRLWDPFTGERVGTLATDRQCGGVEAAVFHPGGRLLATGHGDGTIRFWDLPTGEPVGAPLIGHPGAVTSLAFHPAGHLLAAADAAGTARLWIETPHG